MAVTAKSNIYAPFEIYIPRYLTFYNKFLVSLFTSHFSLLTDPVLFSLLTDPFTFLFHFYFVKLKLILIILGEIGVYKFSIYLGTYNILFLPV